MADYRKIKKEYIKGGVTLRALAEKYKVSESTLRKISAEEEWTGMKKEVRTKTRKNLIKKAAKEETKRIDMFLAIADKLLQIIKDGLDDGSILYSGRLRDITGALKDLKEIKEIRPSLDIEEQLARIEKLKKDAKDGEVKDTTVTVRFEGDSDGLNE